MDITYAPQNKRHKHFATGFLALLLVYLLFHLFVSERSVTSLVTLSAQQEKLEAQLVSVQQERKNLEYKVSKLRPETMDYDLLEEESLRMLGKGHGDAIILLDKDNG